jgi:crotonobetainyl-CoA:carnitine CoA-transferase CaiB-like acyl-CoA transferase
VVEPGTHAPPLAGIRAIDFGQVWAGPLLGQYLADFGAEVIQITTRERAAVQLSGGAGTAGLSPISYSNMGRNRRSFALDTTSEEGRKLFHRLVAASDIVFDNFSPRGASRVGIDYATLSAVNPRIIVASLSAAGQDGPWRDLTTYGPSLTALYGIKSLLGYAGETEIQEDVADLDPTAATYAFIAVMAALRARERTGVGQFIDMAQGEAGMASLAEAVLEYTLNGRVMGPTGNRHRALAPHGIYPTAGDDCWISITVDSERAWDVLCQALGSEALAGEERFRTMYRRLQAVDALDGAIGAATVNFSAQDLTARLQEAGVAAYPVLDTYGVVSDPQLAYRRARCGVAVASLTPEEVYNPTPWLLSATPPTVYGPSRAVDADHEYVLDEVLGEQRRPPSSP